MGETSQIYIRYNIGENKGLIAREYPWNSGERMVSRTRGIIEYIRDVFIFEESWGWPRYIEKLIRICDVNFDMKSVSISEDIVSFYKKGGELFRRIGKGGKLLIDVSKDGIKYALIDNVVHRTIMDCDAYMRWSVRSDWVAPNECFNPDAVRYTASNCVAVSKEAKLMSKEEVAEFLDEDYSYLNKEGNKI